MSYNNSISEKDQSAFPTITVLDVSEEKRYDNKLPLRNCCGCITEQGNAVLLRRLSVVLWIFTVLMFKFSISVYITEVVFKDEYVQACLSAQRENEDKGLNASNWE
ncbi:14945_t:CDS:2, partial [Racocetra fulgida]